jgi:hypothetical protein
MEILKDLHAETLAFTPAHVIIFPVAECFTSGECDFFFSNFRGYLPTLNLGSGTGDNSVSPPIVNSK